MKNIISDLSVENKPLFKNEIEKNNLVVCKYCGYPTRVEMQGLFFRMPCRCSEKKNKLPKKNKSYFDKYNMLHSMQYKDTSFETTELSRFSNIGGAVNNVLKNKDKGLYLWGNTGVGKTHLMICIARELQGSLVIKLDTLLDCLKATYNGEKTSDKELMGEIYKTPYLFIDDIGIENFSKNNGDNFNQRILYKVVEERCLRKQPTFYSSNYSVGQLLNDRGVEERTIDRIVGSCTILKLNGDSYRTLNL